MATKATKSVETTEEAVTQAVVATVAESTANLRASLNAHPETPFASQIDTCLRQIEAYLTAR